MDTVIVLLAVRILPYDEDQLLYSYLIFTSILLAQIPMQWKALHHWFPSERSYYYLVAIILTPIMALVGFSMVLIALLLYFYVSGPHDSRSDLLYFCCSIRSRFGIFMF